MIERKNLIQLYIDLAPYKSIDLNEMDLTENTNSYIDNNTYYGGAACFPYLEFLCEPENEIKLINEIIESAKTFLKECTTIKNELKNVTDEDELFDLLPYGTQDKEELNQIIVDLKKLITDLKKHTI